MRRVVPTLPTTTHACHCAYFCAAAMEGHGTYSKLAGALFCLGIAELGRHAWHHWHGEKLRQETLDGLGKE